MRKAIHCLCSVVGTFTLVSSGTIPETDCGMWISSDGVAVTPSVVLNFWPKAELSSKQSKAMQNRAHAKAEAYRRRWGRTRPISKLHYARNLANWFSGKSLKL